MDENTLLSLVIDASKRVRYKTLLKNPKKRKKLLENLNHNPPLNKKYTVWVPSLEKAIKSIDLSNSYMVHLLSSEPEIDGKIMELQKAVDKVAHYGWGTIIGITPLLAIYYGESGERTAIIQKSA